MPFFGSLFQFLWTFGVLQHPRFAPESGHHAIMSAAMRKPRLSDLEDEIAGHIRQSPLAGIKVPRLLNNEDTEFNLDTITLEQMKSVLPWAHMTRYAWNDNTYNIVRII